MRFFRPTLVMFLILCLVMVMVGGCSSQKPSPSPKPEPIPLPEPEPEPEPEPLWNFDEEELVVSFLEKTYDEFVAEYGEPSFITEDGGHLFALYYAMFFDSEGKCNRFYCAERKIKFLGITIEETSLEETLLLFGEEHFYEEDISEIHEFSTFSYGYEWECTWKEEVRNFRVIFNSDYRDGVKEIGIELLPRP